jgi:putative chitinase
MNFSPTAVIEKEATKSNSSLYLKSIAKNFQSLAGIARDMNVARQNIQKLVTLKGGEKATGADAHFLKTSERAEKLGVEVETERAKDIEFFEKEDIREAELEKKKAPTLVTTKPAEKGKPKKASPLDKLKEMFSSFLGVVKNLFNPKMIMQVLGKLALPLLIVTTIWQGIKGAWDAYQETGSILEAFKGGIGQIVDFFSFGLIDKKMVSEFMDEIPKFFEPIIEAASNFFVKIGEWFSEKFDGVKELFVKPKTPTATATPPAKPTPSTTPKETSPPAKPTPSTTPKETFSGAEEAMKEQRAAAEAESLRRKEEAAKKKTEEAEAAKKKAEADQSITRAVAQEEARKKSEEAEAAKKKVEAAKKVKEEDLTKPTPAAPTVTPVPEQLPVVRPGKPEKELPKPSPSEVKPGKISSAQGKEVVISEMNKNDITDPTARAAIMAQIGHESGNFTTLSENLNYKATSLLKLFPKKFSSPEDAQQVAAGGPQTVAERIYGGRMGNAPEGSGEGFLYRGRGFIQLTGKQNYTRFGYSGNPEEVAKPQTAAESAIKFIMGYKGDWSDVKKLTEFVNGGFIGLEDRAKHFEAYLQDPTITQFETTTKPTSGGYVAQASTEVASGQRQQQKPSTPVVINTTTVNNTAINKNVSTVTAAKENTGNKLASRVA